MHTPPSHDENKPGDFIGHVLKEAFTFLKNAFRTLLRLDIEKKKAISLTIIIMTLVFSFDSSNVFLLKHILGISSFSHLFGIFHGQNGYLINSIIFLIIWSPAIYMLKLHWNSKNIKFYLSLAYAVGLLTYRLNNDEWLLNDFTNFVSCFGTAVLFACLAGALIYFVRGIKEE